MLTLVQQLRIINGNVGKIKCKKNQLSPMHRKENQLSVSSIRLVQTE